MSSRGLLGIDPPELRFRFELNELLVCFIYLYNRTNNHVAYTIMNTNTENYWVEPSIEVLLPRSTGRVVVWKLQQREAPPDMKCKDRFLVASIVTFPGATRKDITPEMFDEKFVNVEDEVILPVVYVSPPNYPSLVPKRSSQGAVPNNGTTTSRKIGSFTEKLSTIDEVRLGDVNVSSPELPSLVPKGSSSRASVLDNGVTTSRKIGNFTEGLGNVMDEVRLEVANAYPPKPPTPVPEGSSPRAFVSDNGTTALRKIGNFTEELGNTMEEVRFGVVNLSQPKLPSPVPEGSSPRASMLDNGTATSRKIGNFTENLSTSDEVRLGAVTVSLPKLRSPDPMGSSPRASVLDDGSTTSRKIGNFTEELGDTAHEFRLGVVNMSPPKPPSPKASVSDNGTTTSRKASNFSEELGGTMEEIRVGVVCVSPPKHSSLFPEGFGGVSSPRVFVFNNETTTPQVFDVGLRRRRIRKLQSED